MFITLAIVTLGLVLLIGAIIGIANHNAKLKSEFNSKDEITLNHMELDKDGNEIEFSDKTVTGYDCASFYVMTHNVDIDKCSRYLQYHILYLDGEPLSSKARATFEISGDRMNVKGTYPDGKQFGYNGPIVYVDSLDGIEFVAAAYLDNLSFTVVADKSTVEENYDVNKLALYVNDSIWTNQVHPTFDLKYSDSLVYNSKIWSTSYYKDVRGEYHHVKANVRLAENLLYDEVQEQQAAENKEETPVVNNDDTTKTDIEQTIETEIEVKEEANSNWFTDHFDKFKDSFNNGINDFKTNFENSQSFKVITIAASSVIGIALLYVIFVIIRKVWRVVKD